VRRGGVCPSVVKGTEIDFAPGDGRASVQQIASGSRQPIKPCHNHHVAGGDFGEKPAKLRPVGPRRGSLTPPGGEWLDKGIWRIYWSLRLLSILIKHVANGCHRTMATVLASIRGRLIESRKLN